MTSTKAATTLRVRVGTAFSCFLPSLDSPICNSRNFRPTCEDHTPRGFKFEGFSWTRQINEAAPFGIVSVVRSAWQSSLHPTVRPPAEPQIRFNALTDECAGFIDAFGRKQLLLGGIGGAFPAPGSHGALPVINARLAPNAKGPPQRAALVSR